MTDAMLIVGELALIVVLGLYADKIAQTMWKPKPRVPCQEWRDMVEPIVKKCRLSATFHGSMRFNAEGSEALANLLERMATELDDRASTFLE